MSKSKSTSPSHHVDIHVGGQLRLVRRQRGWSQEKLADALGVTFQQVQKYERGTNRISASKLFEAAVALATPVSVFFDGLDITGAEAPSALVELASDDLAIDVAMAFRRLKHSEVRNTLAELIRTLSAET